MLIQPNSSAVRPTCRACGLSIEDMSFIGWNGHTYHNDHVPRHEPPPVFEVADLQRDDDSPGLWIGFKTSDDRERAIKWFRVAGQPPQHP